MEIYLPVASSWVVSGNVAVEFPISGGLQRTDRVFTPNLRMDEVFVNQLAKTGLGPNMRLVNCEGDCPALEELPQPAKFIRVDEVTAG